MHQTTSTLLFKNITAASLFPDNVSLIVRAESANNSKIAGHQLEIRHLKLTDNFSGKSDRYRCKLHMCRTRTTSMAKVAKNSGAWKMSMSGLFFLGLVISANEYLNFIHLLKISFDTIFCNPPSPQMNGTAVKREKNLSGLCLGRNLLCLRCCAM